MTHYTIRRILPPAGREEPLPRFLKGQAAEDYYTKPRYQWCGTHHDEDGPIEAHIAALDDEHGHKHVAEVCDEQPEAAD